MRTNISDENRYVLIAQKGDEVLGYCQAIIEKHSPVLETVEYGRISDLAIASSYRRMGIGERLFKEAEKWFSARGIKRIDVRIAVTNQISTRFWRKIGFSPYLETVFMEI
jgi:ribosomal protein S18 acetylase RimI-like enzyme